MVKAYWKEILKEAASHTRQAFGWNSQTFLGILLSFTAFVLNFLEAKEVSMLLKALESSAYALSAALGWSIVVFTFKAVALPAQHDHELRRQVATLTGGAVLICSDCDVSGGEARATFENVTRATGSAAVASQIVARVSSYSEGGTLLLEDMEVRWVPEDPRGRKNFFDYDKKVDLSIGEKRTLVLPGADSDAKPSGDQQMETRRRFVKVQLKGINLMQGTKDFWFSIDDRVYGGRYMSKNRVHAAAQLPEPPAVIRSMDARN